MLPPTAEEPLDFVRNFMNFELHADDLFRAIMKCISLSREGCDRLERAHFKLHELLDYPETHMKNYVTEEDVRLIRFWKEGSLELTNQPNRSREDLQRCAVEYAVYLLLQKQAEESADHHAACSFRPVEPEDVTLLQQRTRYRIRLAEAASDADLSQDEEKRRNLESALEQELRTVLPPELKQSSRVVYLTHSPLVMGCELSCPKGCSFELPDEIANICRKFAGRRVLGLEGSRAGPRIDGFTFQIKVEGSFGLGSQLKMTLSPEYEAPHKTKQLLVKHIDFKLARDETSPQQGPLRVEVAQPERRDTFIDQEFQGDTAIYSNGKTWNTADHAEERKALGDVLFLPPHLCGMSCSGIDHTNVKQNYLGDCWLMAVLSLLDFNKFSENRHVEVLKTRLIRGPGGYDGPWHVMLCHDGEWRTLQLDNRLPCIVHGPDAKPTPAFADGAPSVALVEKAFAKMYSCYESLESGSTDEAFETLTGYPCTRIMLQEATAKDNLRPLHFLDNLWNKLLMSFHAGFLCAATVDGSNATKAKENGLIPEHAYAVLRVDEKDRSVVLRDPWGECQRHANQSAGKMLFSNKRIKGSPSDGTFSKSFEVFVDSFTFVDVCRVQPNWWVARDKFFLPPLASAQWEAADAYELDLAVDSEVELSLIQCNGRGTPTFRPSDLCIFLLRRKDGDSPLELVASSDRLLKPSVHLIWNLEAGNYVALPLTFGPIAPGHTSNRSCVFRIGSSEEFIRCHQACLSMSEVANAIGLHVKKYGVPHFKRQDNIKVYELQDRCGGLLYAENHSTEFLILDVDLSESCKLQSSRGKLSSCDVLPPYNAQLLHALTKDSVKASPKLVFNVKISSVEGYDHEATSIHAPHPMHVSAKKQKPGTHHESIPTEIRLNPMPYGVMNDRDAPQLILDKSIASTPCSSHFAALCSIAHAKSITETVADDLRSESNSSSGVQQVLQKVTRAMYDRDFSFRPIVMDSSGTIIATGRDLEVAADAPCPTDFGTGSCGQNTSIGQPFTTVAFMHDEKLRGTAADESCNPKYATLCSLNTVQTVMGTVMGAFLRASSRGFLTEVLRKVNDGSYNKHTGMDPQGVGFYPFVYTVHGSSAYCVAHGFKPYLVGRNLTEIFIEDKLGTSSDAARLNDKFVKVAMGGGGYMKYRWRDSGTTDPYTKVALIGAVRNLGILHFIGVGFHHKMAPLRSGPHCSKCKQDYIIPCAWRNALVLLGHVHSLLLTSGADSLKANLIKISYESEYFGRNTLRDSNSTSNWLYPFIYDFNGTCVAHGANPERVHRAEISDDLHKSFIEKATNGGGWLRYNWKNNEDETIYPKVAYVTHIHVDGHDFYVGVGLGDKSWDRHAKEHNGSLTQWTESCSSDYQHPCAEDWVHQLVGKWMKRVLTATSHSALQALLQQPSSPHKSPFGFEVQVFNSSHVVYDGHDTSAVGTPTSTWLRRLGIANDEDSVKEWKCEDPSGHWHGPKAIRQRSDGPLSSRFIFCVAISVDDMLADGLVDHRLDRYTILMSVSAGAPLPPVKRHDSCESQLSRAEPKCLTDSAAFDSLCAASGADHNICSTSEANHSFWASLPSSSSSSCQKSTTIRDNAYCTCKDEFVSRYVQLDTSHQIKAWHEQPDLGERRMACEKSMSLEDTSIVVLYFDFLARSAATMPPAALELDGIYAAKDYRARLPSPGDKLSTARLQELLCNTTQALVHLQSGLRLVARDIRRSGRGGGSIQLSLEPGGEPVAGEVIAKPWVELNAAADKRLWSFITLGFVGGEFQRGAKKVRVESVLSNPLGVRRVVVRAQGGTKKATEMSVDEQLHSFPPTAVARPTVGGTPPGGGVGRGGEQDSADFGDFPHIAAALRGAGMLGVAETSTRMEDVREFLTALAGAGRLEASRIGAVVVSTERLLESRGIGKKDVERALRFGGGGHASPADKQGDGERRSTAARVGAGRRPRLQLPADTEPESDVEWRDEGEAIRAFFKSGKVREAAAFEVPEDLDDEEEAEAHELAASLAVKRLKTRVGASWVPKERLQSLAELRL
ncbi:MAG: hypothetical protein SGPRY_000403 [Prymnesium sp.]